MEDTRTCLYGAAFRHRHHPHLGGGDRVSPDPAYPNTSAFCGVSGTSHSNPSMAINRHDPSQPPRVSRSATRAATCENSSASGSGPSRRRPWVIPPLVGTEHARSQHPIRQRVRQPGDDLLVVLLGEQRHRHREVHHHMRRKLAIRPLRALAGQPDRLIDRVPRPAHRSRSSRSAARSGNIQALDHQRTVTTPATRNATRHSPITNTQVTALINTG